MNAQQLKNSILQLAVQGKLVPQDPNDEPASALIERIRAEKERLIKDKKIKPDKNPSYIFRGSDNLPYEKVGKNEPVCIADEVPFDIPDSWGIIRLNDIGIYKKGPFGSSLTKSMFVSKSDSSIKVYEQKNAIQKDATLGNYYITKKYYEEKMSGFTVNPGDIIVSCAGTIGETYVMPDNIELGIINQALMKMEIFAPINIAYFLLYFDYVLKQSAKDSSKGSAIKNIPPFDIFKKLLLPLPSLAEQQRIVDKLKELEPYINDYDKAYEKIEKLNTDFPDLLKKSILQEAVQGKLVPQDPTDKPASVLIEQIRKEKEQLIKDKKIKKDKNESYIFRRDNSHYEKIGKEERCIDDEIPFDIPDSWEWTRLGTILEKLTDGTHSTPIYVEHGIPFLSVKDISQGNISFKNTKYITKEEHMELYKRCDPKMGDILLTKVGTTGIPVIVDTDKEFSLFVSVAQLRFKHKFINPEYLKYLILSPLVQVQCRENTKGVGNKNWVMRDIANTLIVIPPFDEQKRIVEKVKQILPEVNHLK